MDIYWNGFKTYLLRDTNGTWFSIYDGRTANLPSVVQKASYQIENDVLCKYQKVDFETLEHLKEELEKAGAKLLN